MKESCVHGCVMTSVASPFIRENGDVFQHFLLSSSIESLFYCCEEFLYTFADKVVELTRHHFRPSLITSSPLRRFSQQQNPLYLETSLKIIRLSFRTVNDHATVLVELSKDR